MIRWIVKGKREGCKTQRKSRLVGKLLHVSLDDLAQTVDGGAHGGGSSSGHLPAATSESLVASAARPDAGGLPLDGVLAAEGAVVLGVLKDLELLRDLTQRRAVAGSVLTGDADLLGSLGHLS